MKSLLFGVISDIIRDELADPRLGIYSLTEMELSRDLSIANIKVATVGGPEASQQTCDVLNRAAPLLWNRIRHETDLRIVPKLHFSIDATGQYADRIFTLLEEIGPLPADEPEAGPLASADAPEAGDGETSEFEPAGQLDK